ncbi:hypothetical protein D1BOALGB6SA_4182 [Olavius sp. associated proteobacterium Delta 1]|nr:hypothetical protein D1BOALGB6SA_4182 [Olavius sp. associated proteobacterium Delta 1]
MEIGEWAIHFCIAQIIFPTIKIVFYYRRFLHEIAATILFEI